MDDGIGSCAGDDARAAVTSQNKPAATQRQADRLLAMGEAEQALGLYRSLATLLPAPVGLSHPNLRHRMGQALAALGRHAEAEAAFAAAIALAPGREEFWRDWLAAFPRAPGAATDAAATASGVVLDVTDLAQWIRHGHRAPSGIQRVQLEIAQAALALPQPPVICAMPAAGGGWRRWPPALFHRIDHLMRLGADPSDPAWRNAAALLADTLEETPLAFAKGATLVSLGGSWGQPDHLSCLRQARAHSGLRHVPLLHDCVPLVVPEHCRTGTVHSYARWFASLALHADGILANSHSTQSDLLRLHAAMLPGLPPPASAVLPLDATPRPPPPEAASPILPRALRGGRPYVLFVATIEARKNHLMVFQAWLTLLRRLESSRPDLAVPDLVCVGRPGWRAEAALELLDNAPALRGRVHLLHDVADPLLAALYQGCRFTLYNSYHEGWGLPVTESLAASKAVLAPAHSALLEAGQGGATFFESGSEPDLVAKLEAWITNPAALAAAEAAIAAAPPRRDWAGIATQLLTDATRLSRDAPPRPPLPLRPGTRIALRRLEHPRPLPAMAVAEAARAGPGWHPLEADGAWTRPGIALLHLPLGPEFTGPLRLELELRAPPRDQVVALRLRRQGEAFGPTAEIVLPANTGHVTALDVPAGDSIIEVMLECASTAIHADGRKVGVGVMALSVARGDSAEDRLAVLEARLFRVMMPV
jgi:glycosyltransferase involved in cell wall biosynthesis